MMKFSKYIFFFTCAFTLLVSCKKADYLTDSGVHSVNTPLTHYDYLQQNSWKLFDTFLLIVDKFNLKQEMNSAATVFAPTDYSIGKFMTDRLNEKLLTSSQSTYTLDSLYKYISADSVLQYMFAQKITIPELTTNETQLYTSLGRTSMGAYKELQQANAYTQYTNNPTYLLYLVKVRGPLDVPGVVPPIGEGDTRVLCQTTGIGTSDGTKTLHALNNTHTFIRF